MGGAKSVHGASLPSLPYPLAPSPLQSLSLFPSLPLSLSHSLTHTYPPSFLSHREIANAQAGLPAHVTIKCNGLDDEVMVEKLYEAGMAGVRVDCIVRGMCRIRPGVKGVR